MVISIEQDAARNFAVEVVQTLRDAGYEALWAGGCVRDQQLGRTPKDYDVATNATPGQVREVFGHRRTLAIGAAFGVIAVRGPREAGMIEVATFRQDGGYSDGRRPDEVVFSTAEEDAQRRDFTINGMFFDPLEQQVIDYVGGMADLKAGIVRAIGDPHQRIAEDKLRMLRAVRFAGTFGFQLEVETAAAIKQHTADVSAVSAERIAMEMQRMLVHSSRAVSMQMMRRTGLLAQILPGEYRSTLQQNTTAWAQSQQILQALSRPTFPLSLAALLRAVCDPADRESVIQVCKHWKLSNEDTLITGYLHTRCHEILTCNTSAWPQLQRLLITPHIDQLLQFSEAIAAVTGSGANDVKYARRQLSLPVEELNPPSILDGNDLKRAGLHPGPMFKTLIETVRNAQLEKQISTKEEAVEFARRMLK